MLKLKCEVIAAAAEKSQSPPKTITKPIAKRTQRKPLQTTVQQYPQYPLYP